MSKKKDLLPLRKEIDSIDRQIARLCKQRLQVTQKVFEIKATQELPLTDTAREGIVIERFTKVLTGHSTKSRTRHFVRALIELNPQYPQRKRNSPAK